MRLRLSALVVGCLYLMSLTTAAQESSTAPAGAAASNLVPSLINYSGVLRDASGRPLTGVTGVTFLLYSAEQGGAPLWLETQNVVPDKTGHYTAQLGATSAKGLPYAMKAADAQTLSGLPASAFVLAAPPSSGAPAATGSSAISSSSSFGSDSR
jgi:hypothetical protein